MMSMFTILIFTVCLANGTDCEEHTKLVEASQMTCWARAQSFIAESYPLREGQRIERISCEEPKK